jgi:S-DNA-T family DNA segregation ATPase FtsK/SpoIIIE
MAVNDMMNGNFNADEARYDRMNRMNPAEFAPGQTGAFQANDIFAQSAVQNSPNQMNDIFSSGVGNNMFDMNPTGGGIPTGNSMQMQQPQQPKTQEEMFYDSVKQAGSAGFGFFKELTGSISQLTPRWYSEWGKTITITGSILALVGVVLRMFGFSGGLKVAIGGLVSAAGGVLIWFLLTDKAKSYNSKYKDENNTNQSFNNPPASMPNTGGMDMNMNMGMSSGFDNFNPAPSMGGGDDWGLPSSDDGDDWSIPSSDNGDDDDYGDDYDIDDYTEEAEDTGTKGMTTEEALNSLQEIPQGMYTRQYLWDMFTRKLPTMKPDFSRMRQIDEDDDAFLYWDEKLREAAKVAGCKEDFLPDLKELKENLFTVIVTCNRPTGFKPEAVSQELANIYAYKDGTKNENVFAKFDTVGEDCIITIFNGASAMISLKDMMLQEKDFILDTKNYIPVVIGVDQLGHVIKVDLKKLESIIVTGMPRSGKSWFVQAILTQMCAFVPPSELHIYIGDPKEGISDFKAFTLPHVKKFVSEDAKIVNMLRDLVKVEGPRRKKIIGDAGFVNIWDFKERYPDVKMPVIYVIIDEIVTLASRMDKETGVEFRMLLRELISQLPALGIRAFLIPHVLNNDIIEKKTSDLVPCKISVKGNADHIEKATGAKAREFPYKLVNSGDMAVKLANVPNVMYVHGPALTSSNPENNDLFDYLRRAWTKLEPEEAKGSISEKAEDDAANTALLNSLDSGDLPDVDLFTEENGDGLSGFSDASSNNSVNSNSHGSNLSMDNYDTDGYNTDDEFNLF